MCIKETVNTKFLCLPFDNHINWKNCTEPVICKSSGAYYAIRLMVHIKNINTLKSVYYAYCHSVIKCGFKLFGVTLTTVGRFPLYKRKLSELWVVHNPEPRIEVYFNN
jgi:hypothetical protein